MADEQAVIKRMEQYAKAAARKVLQKFGLGQDQDRHEDILQTLFLAGWEVWRDTGEWEKARHRMVDRAKNEAKALRKDLKIKQMQGDEASEPWYGSDDEADATERYQHESPSPRLRPVVVRSSAEEDLEIQ